ncbi:hypothetical protein [Pseudomonas canadensis]|uniref:DUF3077 domain-containing protein n=1 Tax=Pseudomonas canadensis TaxID=915099 RepID=A0ABZ0ZZX3_9PSED|nr:hypothetical protein [Pseudomonas canadensis]WRI22580.1 hypothetical protein SPL95_18395 [Pseudomonas canadensis]
MNDAKFTIEKARELLKASKTAEGLIEQAAIFGAISVLIRQLDVFFKDHAPHMSENMERLRWHSAAVLGYETTNGKSSQDHYVWALGVLGDLESALDDIDL